MAADSRRRRKKPRGSARGSEEVLHHPPAGTLLYTTPEAAAFLRETDRTLALWRAQRRGPRYVKQGKRVTYRREDLDAWVLSSIRLPRETPPLRGRGRELNS